MAAVFIMQPIGQLVAWAVGMAALQGLSRDYNLEVGILTTNPDEIDNAKIGIDIFWRIVVGVGAVPALIAVHRGIHGDAVLDFLRRENVVHLLADVPPR